jgi:broad specificity phosphatase PhoE
MECYLPGIQELDSVWVEMYQFGMTHSTHTHPDWERRTWFEPTTGKLGADMLSVISECWRRARYLKAAAPKTALVCCHGTVMDNLIRWTPEPRDQRILFERIQRTYLDAETDGLAFWCWTDDETSSRPEPEYFYREGEAMGMINFQGAWRPVGRRAATYARAAPAPARVNREVLLLMPTPHLMGLDRIDTFTTASCVVSALARLGVAPDVKATYFRGHGPIPLRELQDYKVVIVGADEYRKDLPEVPGVLRRYVERGGRLVLALGRPDQLLSPTLEPLPCPELVKLTGLDRVQATNHQHTTHWFKSVRWQLAPEALPYWDQRRGRWMPGRGEKRLVYKFVELPKDATLIAEAAVSNPAENDVAYGSAVFASAGENRFWPLYYSRPLGRGRVFVLAYTLNVFRGHLDEIDVQREDWDWVLQAALDDARVTTDPCQSLSVLAQEFLHFRPTR